MYYTFKICKSGGFEVIPKGNISLDLFKLAEKFENVKVKTKVILVVEVDEVRTSIYPSGKILLRDCDEDKAQGIAAKLYNMIKNEVAK